MFDIIPNLIFTLLFLLYMFDYMDRLVIVSLFPFLKQEWGITDTQCGLLVSAVYWSILIFTLPVSILIDRWSRIKSIGLMAVLWSAATLACAFTKNFGQLFAARTAIGLGEAGYVAGRNGHDIGLIPQREKGEDFGNLECLYPFRKCSWHCPWRNHCGSFRLASCIRDHGPTRHYCGHAVLLCQGL